MTREEAITRIKDHIEIHRYHERNAVKIFEALDIAIKALEQPEYEPVKAEDFAKMMSENTIYGFMSWHNEALELMNRYGFVICKKTM